MTVLTANELKVKGVSSIERLLEGEQEVIISVRGKPRYVVMDIAHYELLREHELEAAWSQTRADVSAGRYRQESAEAHIDRLKDSLSNGL